MFDALCQAGANAVELHRECGIPAFGTFFNLADCFPTDIAGLDNVAGRSVEFGEAVVQGLDALLLLIGGGAGFEFVIEKQLEFFASPDGIGAELAEMIAEEIEGNASKPGAERTVGREFGDFSVSGNKHFLRKVVGFVPGIEALSEVGSNHRLVGLDELRKGWKVSFQCHWQPQFLGTFLRMGSRAFGFGRISHQEDIVLTAGK